MFYTFNTFWIATVGLCAAWVAYGVLGYELCVITLLTLILLQTKEKK